MSIDLIGLLKDKVTPQVLGSEANTAPEKASVLENFYPIMLTILAKFPGVADQLAGSKTGLLKILLNNNQSHTDNFLSNISGSMSNSEVQPLLERSIPAVLGTLNQERGTQDLHSFIRGSSSSFEKFVPAWAAGLIGTFVGRTEVKAAAPATHETDDRVNKSKWWIPLLGLIPLLIIAAFIWKACSNTGMKDIVGSVNGPDMNQEGDTMVTADGLAPADFALEVNEANAVTECKATAGNELAMTLKNAVAETFGSDATCAVTSSDKISNDLKDQENLTDILQAVKAVPGAKLTWMGDKINLTAPDEAQLKTLADTVTSLAPNTTVTTGANAVTATQDAVAGAADNIESTVNESIDSAKDALKGIASGKNSSAEDVVKALNIQIINFASGSSAVPDANKQVLNEAAQALKTFPNVKFNIEGHTDSTGNAAANKILSEKRAKAVVSYLAAQGVNASNLNAVGYGAERPVADNSTDEGKFKNRRIQFAISK